MKIRKYLESTVATTHLDRQNERISSEALQDMAKQANENPIWVTFEHDPAMPPLGIGLGAEVKQLPDGEFALISKLAMFDLNSYNFLDKPNELKPFEFSKKIANEPENITIKFNPYHVESDFFEQINEIDNIPVQYIKVGEKSIEPAWWILIVLAPLVDGFIKGAVKEATGKTVEDFGGEFIKYVSKKIYELKEKITDSCVKSKMQSDSNRRYYVIFEFMVKSVSCEALILLKKESKKEIFAEIEEAENHLNDFLSLSEFTVEENSDINKLKMIYIPSRGWEISFATTKSGEVLVGEIGKAGLKIVAEKVP